MTEAEARDQALRMLGLDEFQRIAADDILRDLDGLEWPPPPGSEHEKKLIELGALVSERFS